MTRCIVFRLLCYEEDNSKDSYDIGLIWLTIYLIKGISRDSMIYMVGHIGQGRRLINCWLLLGFYGFR